jgi:hypothetical protein
VPLASPELQLASGPTDAPVTPPPTSAEPSLSGEVVVAMRYLQLEGVSHPRLYLYRANGQFLRQLTREPGPVDDINPFFSPDGSVIIFTRVTAAERTCWSIEPLGSDLHQLKEPPAWYQTVEGRSGLVDSDSPTLSPSPSAPPETSDIISDKTDDNYSETHYRLPDRRGQFIRKEDLKKDTVTYSVVDSNGNTHVLDYSEDSSFVGAFDPDGNVHFLTKGNRTFVILYLHDSTINSFSIADLSDYSVTPLVSNIKSVDPKNLDEQVSGLSDVFSIPEGFLVTAFHKYESYGTENNYHTDHASYIEFFDNQFKHNISYSQPGAGMPYGFSWYRKDVTPHVRWLPVAIPEKGLVVPDPKDLSQQ